MKVRNDDVRLFIAGDVTRRDPKRNGIVRLGTHLMPGQTVENNDPAFVSWVKRAKAKGHKLTILKAEPEKDPLKDPKNPLKDPKNPLKTTLRDRLNK